eukprot:CAMPEP_0184734306 /NCGR_PEP_ID=MMETSP0314-20130426/60091_1 /TAXON_ID=38298 /ORGANISM="Rhodella maculata, Strain CCMP 736" /LENGTH=54 /DNA_ID=CAMNT_0027201235 /DNA_START=203 /DNA_END=363 /DNA_ORIENTATION=+
MTLNNAPPPATSLIISITASAPALVASNDSEVSESIAPAPDPPPTAAPDSAEKA